MISVGISEVKDHSPNAFTLPSILAKIGNPPISNSLIAVKASLKILTSNTPDQSNDEIANKISAKSNTKINGQVFTFFLGFTVTLVSTLDFKS